MLLAVSVLIWGWVFLKIYHVVAQDDDAEGIKDNRRAKVKYTATKDTFELLVNYKDPFFKRMTGSVSYSDRVAGPARKATMKNNPAPGKPVMDWSFIKYKGRITRHSTKKTLSLLNINGSDYAIEDGKEVQQVLLLKSHVDSILVRFEGMKKYIKRNTN